MTTAVEEFPNYAEFLDSTVWPAATRAGKSHPEIRSVDDMPPQYAAAALAKLVRWAVFAPQGELRLLAEVSLREEAVRSSTLGIALAARAQNLLVGEHKALHEAEPAPKNHVLAELAVVVQENTELPLEVCIDIAADALDRISSRNWKIVEE